MLRLSHKPWLPPHPCAAELCVITQVSSSGVSVRWEQGLPQEFQHIPNGSGRFHKSLTEPGSDNGGASGKVCWKQGKILGPVVSLQGKQVEDSRSVKQITESRELEMEWGRRYFAIQLSQCCQKEAENPNKEISAVQYNLDPDFRREHASRDGAEILLDQKWRQILLCL
ncbi:hypothetical protein BTVI_75154 [Pitangus sulphuratus]|nr:hypothetical protein BTVI_75154 [Pitangus sulphuratus]